MIVENCLHKPTCIVRTLNIGRSTTNPAIGKNMFDLSKQTASFNCENCGRSHKVKFADVAAGRTVSCACGTTIKLVDHGGSVAKGVRDVNAGFKKLEDAIKKINRR